MKKFFKSALSVVLALTIVFSSVLIGVSELDFSEIFAVKSQAASSGTCGENLTWSLDDTGTLTISGTGDMYDYDYIEYFDSYTPWYSFNNNITNVYIDYGVTSIGAGAFAGTSVVSVTIPESVVSIGSGAFSYCKSLISIIIPNNITNIGSYLFYSCRSLESITIPDEVQSIDYQAFYNCESLISITIPDSVTSIGDCIFENCTSLVSVTIGNSVTSIGDRAFHNCTSLISITIPDSVTSISEWAFYNTGFYNNDSNWENGVLYIGNHLIETKESITGAYEIKNGTKTIADNAFSYCDSLTSVTIPDSVKTIGYSAFYVCDRLNSIEIPDSVISIGDYAFTECTRLKSVTIPQGVQSIGSRTFCDCLSLVSITVADGVQSIGFQAFYNCRSLTSIIIPDSVQSIAPQAFYNCRSLTSITIPDGVQSIAYQAFYNCDSLTSIIVPDSITYIGTEAFYETGYYNDSNNWENDVLYIGNHIIKALTSLSGNYEIKKGTKCIASEAFAECESLTSIAIPDSVVSINSGAFFRCIKLEAVHIKDMGAWCGISFSPYLDDLAGYEDYFNPLRYAGKLYLNGELVTDLVIPNSVTSIGNGVFSGCTSLASITIPDSVTSIGSDAFNGCTSLASITIPGGVTSIGSDAFNGCTSLASITIPGGVTSIGSGAFNGCTSLASITVPDSITSIGFDTFRGCTSLASIIIPDSVTSIGDCAFYKCTSLKYVFYAGSREQWRNIDIDVYNTNLTKAIMHYESVDHNESWEIDVNATCTQTGSKHKECTVCGIVYETAEIPATGHSLSDWIIDKAAICTETGSKHKECTDCGETLETAVINATGHKVVKDAAVAATCTAVGKTEGSHCSVCDVVFVAQQTIPAKGHTASAFKYNEETRTEYKECTVCKEVLESKYNPLNTTKITSCYNEVNGVQLKWNATDDAVEYDIYRKLPSQNEWTLIATTSNLTYQDKNVVGNTVYQYRLKALDQYNNESVFSAQRECRFIATPELAARESAVGGVKITWKQVAGATSYRIYRRGAGTDYWYYLGDVSATQNTFFDKESSLVSSGNYYRYTVRASYSGKDSAGKDYLIYSGFDTNGLYLKYVATPKLTSISNATGGLQIKWNAVNGNGRMEYRVYRRGAGSTSWTYLGTTTGTTWTDTKIANANGSYYRYTVRAVQGTNGNGWYSAFDTSGLFLMRLANPTLKSAVSSSAGITVKWSSVKGATSYYVYRKTANSGWTRIATVNGNANTTHLDKTAKKGVTYTYTVRAVYGKTTSYFNSGISCKDKY